jgi:hypothetical protein
MNILHDMSGYDAVNSQPHLLTEVACRSLLLNSALSSQNDFSSQPSKLYKISPAMTQKLFTTNLTHPLTPLFFQRSLIP